MGKSVRGRGLAIIIAILLPLVVMGLQNTVTQPTVWIVYSVDNDTSIELASTTLSDQIVSHGCIVRETVLSKLDVIPLYSEAIVLIGHGQSEGFEISDSTQPWDYVIDTLNERKPQMLMLLACDSPSDSEVNIFGFPGEIDARAGALLVAWKVLLNIFPSTLVDVPLELAIDSQIEMKHPLTTEVYFVHGYLGDNSIFGNMIEILDLTLDTNYDDITTYSYFSHYPALTDEEVHNLEGGISTYAEDFKNELVAAHTPGTQIDIVAHSLGGLITREMLRLYRTDLESAGIEIGRVITLGTPHTGTEIASPTPSGQILLFLIDLFAPGVWDTPVFDSVWTQSSFITNLNDNPEIYSTGIEWYTIAAIDALWNALFFFVHNGRSDGLVSEASAILSFSDDYTSINANHAGMVSENDSLAFTYVENWLDGSIDTDNDGIMDTEERYIYYTDPFLADSDFDNIPDGQEVFTYYTNPLLFDTDGDYLGDGDELWTYGTNPLAWGTDGDILGDGQEIAWGYDPLDTDDPIDADHLTYTAWQVGGTTGYVRANHYAAMDYVKVYVRYMTSTGVWKPYNYVGIDYTPYYSGDYYVSWSLQQGYAKMQVKVQAYNPWDIYLGCDTQYVIIPSGGGPPIE